MCHSILSYLATLLVIFTFTRLFYIRFIQSPYFVNFLSGKNRNKNKNDSPINSERVFRNIMHTLKKEYYRINKLFQFHSHL